MKEKIHPAYKETIITCGCGATIKTRSTKADMKLEVCSNCHPFFTGQQKFVDIAGRVDKFKKSFKKAGSTKPVKTAPKTASKKKPTKIAVKS